MLQGSAYGSPSDCFWHVGNHDFFGKARSLKVYSAGIEIKGPYLFNLSHLEPFSCI